MDAVTAADHRHELRFARATLDHLAQIFNVRNQDVSGLDHLYREGGIQHVAAGQAKVQPTARWRADVFGDVRRKRDDVVVERLLEFFAALDVEGGFGLHLREVLFRYDAFSDEGFG